MDKTTILYYIDSTIPIGGIPMSATLISFQALPKFGFAHHLYTEDPWQEQKNLQKNYWKQFLKPLLSLLQVDQEQF